MYPRRPFGAIRILDSLITVVFLTSMVGCDTSLTPAQFDPSRRTVQADAGNLGDVTSPVHEDGLENNLFEAAQPAPIPTRGSILIEGSVTSGADVDLYMLGPALKGDRITIQVTGHGGFNTVAALFDGNADLIDANDDRSFYGGLIDPYISRVVREDTDNLFLGITVSTAAHFASNEGRFDSGSYTIEVGREPGVHVDGPRDQVVYMDFAGGADVQIGLEPIAHMRPFSAESISGRLNGKSDTIIDQLVDLMRRDFAPYHVTLLDSRHDSRPAGPHTQLFFGNYNSRYLGLADNVDTGNAFLEQEAIIYAEDISLFESLLPTAEEVAQALANIGSHELGHLLGLEHSGDQRDVMATAATARQILENDADFLRSITQPDVFPVGFQNEPVLLLRNVGANPNAGSSRLRLEDLLPKPNYNWRDRQALPDISIVPCGRCASSES